MQSHGRWHLLALQHANLKVSFCKNNKLTATDKDHIILRNKQLSQPDISVASTSLRHHDQLLQWTEVLSTNEGVLICGHNYNTE